MIEFTKSYIEAQEKKNFRKRTSHHRQRSMDFEPQLAKTSTNRLDIGKKDTRHQSLNKGNQKKLNRNNIASGSTVNKEKKASMIPSNNSH